MIYQPTHKLQYRACMGNLLLLGAKMCIWNLTEGRSRNCDFKCKLGTYFCGFGLYSCNAILHTMCFQFCLHRDIHKKCIGYLYRYRQHFHHILFVISVLTYNCNNKNEKFVEPNELSILICQICYKTNSNFY